MDRIPEITTDEQITAKLSELKELMVLCSTLIGQLSNLKTKLKLDLSPSCDELGKSAEFIADCRDKFIDIKINGLAVLLGGINNMYNKIDPSKGMLNRDFNKEWFDQNTASPPANDKSAPFPTQFNNY